MPLADACCIRNLPRNRNLNLVIGKILRKIRIPRGAFILENELISLRRSNSKTFELVRR